MNEFAQFCEAHKLNYSLDFGTLLGAVRDHAFIAWDDDVDIAMLRDDYDRFLILSQQWYHDNIFVQFYESDPQFVHSFVRIKLNNSLALQEEWAHLDKHHGIFIDVFPYDVVPSDEETRSQHEKEIYELQALKLAKVKRKKHFHWHSLIQTLRNDYRGLFSLRHLNILQTRAMTRYNDSAQSNTIVTHMSQGFPHYYEFRRSNSDFKNTEKVMFEGRYFPIHSNYVPILQRIYGDYLSLPPEDERFPHHGFIELEFRQDILSGNESVASPQPSVLK